MTGVSECSQQRSNLKDDGYISILLINYFLEKVCLINSCKQYLILILMVGFFFI
ncbi:MULTISPECIES: hypothetical protein [unclassified Photorhabdus]|uniref:hypothetical protein n=1 Tax=unclassified Photorhabdus TaxID=2620880 RepID=UPI0002DE4A4F|nr:MULTISPECIES: hypothetical protein [unclassified Photorhabdus]NDK97240.1 hypothetical protein [Photorhabdus laumondii subsp. laumondii]